VMPLCKPCSSRHILEDDRAVLDEPPGSNRAVLTVENGLLRAGIGHPALGLPHFARLLLNACIRHSVSRILRMLCALTCGSSQGEHPA